MAAVIFSSASPGVGANASPNLGRPPLAPLARRDDDPGHSEHGSAFDSGMRTRPWVIKGIGDTPFLITTKSPEAQKWFNQGNALLHSFWFEEAERSFRWCLKLDPDCAMAYWGLARCGMTWFDAGSGKLTGEEYTRYKAFLKEAIKREGSVSERERDFIEVWAKGFAEDVPNRGQKLCELLGDLSKKYPDDVEAKALYGLFSIGHRSAADVQKTIDEVLAKNPMHPGAHHASIHDWDESDPGKALKSCQLYGKAAPGVGHALHMPGHIYSKIGMWHEAGIAMDSATRVELKYMNDRLALPYEDWDYAHNRNYLCDIQEQLGMLRASLNGSRDMLNAPRDKDSRGSKSRAAIEGFEALLRALVKFERWDDLLRPGAVPWDDATPSMLKLRPAYELLAMVGQGKVHASRTRLDELKQQKNGVASDLICKVAEANLLILAGDSAAGIKALTDAASHDRFGGDPPEQPWPVSRVLGDAELRLKDYPAAVKAYQAALVKEPNDGFSLAGLALAYHAMGDGLNAEKFGDRLVYEWSHADPGLRWMDEVKSLGLGRKPVAETLAPERVYEPSTLAHFGPSNWRPFAAPKLEVLGVDSKRVNLKQYAGRNVLLVFFLGDSCVHCVQQLETINKRMGEFEKQNTVVLAVCSSSPSKNKESKALGDVKITLLSDRNHENARRFASYDDFENLELHSTILIDGEGRVRWKRTGGDPFSDVNFLLDELKHVNATASRPAIALR